MVHIGVFGGTFDPPHIGHLIIAQEALDQAGLDRVVFMPAPVPPHKRDSQVSPFDIRLAMVRAAVGGNPRFRVSDLEVRLPAPSFTVDTLRELRREEPEWEAVYLIIGSDSLLELPTWKTPDEVMRLARLVVYPREGAAVAAAPPELLARSLVLDVPLLPVSSTALRRRAREGRNLRYWLPEGVRELVVAHDLYVTFREV